MSATATQLGKCKKREYQNVTKAKKYEEMLMEAAEPYFEMEDRKKNSGQLKFLKELMIRQIAVSTNVKVSFPKKRMKQYLEESILNLNCEGVNAIFNPQKNMEDFLDTIYCKVVMYRAELRKTEFPNEGGIPYPPYLLLQKTREAVEISMNRYISANTSEKTQEAYSEFLIGVAWYEIILRECCKRINKELKAGERQLKRMESSKVMDECLEQAKYCKNEEECVSLAKKMAENTEEYLAAVVELEATLLMVPYFIRQQTSFYALLRILTLVEWVNINGYHRGAKEAAAKIEHVEAKQWMDLMGKFIEKGVLFGFTERKQNLGSLYRKFNQFVRGSSLLPSWEKEERGGYRRETVDLEMAIMDYLDGIKKPLSQREEDLLWDTEERLAQPIWQAVEKFSIV